MKIFNKKNSLLFLLALVVLIILISFIYTLSTERRPINPLKEIKAVETINRDVRIIYADGRSNFLDLPGKIETDEKYKVILDLSKYSNIGLKSFDINTSYASMNCIVDGETIYEYNPNSLKYFKSGTKAVHVIDIPDDIQDKKIILEFRPALEGVNKRVLDPIHLGTREGIVFRYLFVEETLDIFFVLVFITLFIIGIMLALSSFFRGYYKKEFFNVGFLCLFIAGYFGGKLWVVKYFLSERNSIAHFVWGISILLFTVPVLILINDKISENMNKIVIVAIIVSYFNVFIQLIFLFVFKVEFKLMEYVTYLILIINFVIATSAIIRIEDSNQSIKRVLIYSIFPLLFIELIHIVVFTIFAPVVYNEILQIGFLLYVVFEINYLLKEYIFLKNAKTKDQAFKELVLVDQATGINTRNAFIEKLKDIDTDNSSLWIVTMNLNDMETINREYGYGKGDLLIEMFSEIIKESIKDYESATVFRVAGDKFTILLFEDNSFEPTRIIRQIKQGIKASDYVSGNVSAIFSYGLYYHSSKYKEKIEKSIMKAIYRMNEYKKIVKNDSNNAYNSLKFQ